MPNPFNLRSLWSRTPFGARSFEIEPGARDNLAETLKRVESRLAALELNANRRSAYLGDHTCLTHLLTGQKIYVDTRDVGIASHLMLSGNWEPWIANVLMAYVKPGMRVCDIGANFGYYTLLMAAAVGERGRVFSVEINPRMLELLHKSIRVNGYDERVTLLEVAAWDRDENLSLTFDENYSGGGYVRPAPARETASALTPGRRLDALIDGPVDVIKIDIEGAEQRALAGLEKTIAASKRLVIVMEFMAASFTDPVGFLTSYAAKGFRIDSITPGGLQGADSPAEIVASLSGNLGYLLLVRE